MNKFFGLLLVLTTWGCGPHHVQQVQMTITKYTCVNWIQTIAICDTQEQCNAVCKEAREKAK